MRSWGWGPSEGLSVLIRRERETIGVSLSAMWGPKWEGSHLEVGSHQEPNLPASGTVRNKHLLFKPLSCYSSLRSLIHKPPKCVHINKSYFSVKNLIPHQRQSMSEQRPEDPLGKFPSRRWALCLLELFVEMWIYNLGAKWTNVFQCILEKMLWSWRWVNVNNFSK